MTNFPTQDKITNSILTAIIKAKENFLFWTNNRLPLSYGPRKILTIHIAQELALLEDTPEIFINATITDILRCSLDNRKDYINFMKERNLKEGTLSITLDERFSHKNDNDSISKIIISIQSNVINAKTEYLNEIEVLCKILNKDNNYNKSTLDYGIFAFYTNISSNARKKLDKRIPEIIKSFDKIVANYDNLKANFKGGDINKANDNEEWAIGCYIIEPFYN